MLWLYIVGGILAFLLIILMMSVGLNIYASKDEYKIDVTFAFLKFSVYPQKAKKPKKEKHRKQKKNKKSEPQTASQGNTSAGTEVNETSVPQAEKKASDKSNKKTKTKKQKKQKKSADIISRLRETLGMLEGISKHFKRLIKGIRINLDIELTIGGEDAAKAAINYGKWNAILWAFIGQADSIMTLNAEKVKVNCDFENDRITYIINAKIRLRLITLVIAGIGIAFRALVNYKKKER